MPEAEGLDEVTVRLPAAAARALGLSAGSRIEAVVRRGGIELKPDIHSPGRVYIEPTSRCNLACRTCAHRGREEEGGDMSPAVFARVFEGIKTFPHLSSAMLGGFGEPALHPDILGMVRGLAGLGLEVEMVTNGTLLDERLAAGLEGAGLGRLWVSFDGAGRAGYERVREGGSFGAVLENVKRIASGGKLKVGLAFVATRSNVGDLPRLGDLARETGADRVSVSNVIPYTAEMEKQLLCGQALSLGTFANIKGRVSVDLPRLDAGLETREALVKLLGGCENLSLMGSDLAAGDAECRFIRERCLFVRWDGEAAPCMALLHGHEVHFKGGVRRNRPHSFGNALQRPLAEIWNSPAYRDFREKVAAFDFSPCHVCGTCSYAEGNEEDCGGNRHPAACGGCLWGRGVIQCP